MIRILFAGALLLALSACATPDSFRMRGGMPEADGAALAKVLGAIR